MRVMILCALGALLGACGVPTTPDAAADASSSESAVALDAQPDVNECGNGTQRACYSGRPGSSGVGVCRPGVQRCFGGAWGPCVGETTPGAEVCGNGADDDCDGRVDCGVDAGPEAGDASREAGGGPCVDGDGDGYGMGAGCRGPDCNDADRETHPGAQERCDGQDNDCDGMPETAANAPALDAWCRANAPDLTYPANWRDVTQCDGPMRVRTNPRDPQNMVSFACRVCYRSPDAPFDTLCYCWRSPTDRRRCVDYR